MTNKETIDHWAEYIIPAVFKAEEALQEAKPEWTERLAVFPRHLVRVFATGLAQTLYEIARIIVTQGVDYVPDGSIDGDADFTQ